jgi:peptidoglycan/xylan/chitin deacetylase (PgdA/CDA1 family)
MIPKYSTRAKRSVWLTFDDGPHRSNTEQVLKALDQFKIRATFFVIGENVEKLQGIVRRTFDAGHRVGNHSFTHPHLPQLSPDKVREEIQKTDSLILPYAGTDKILRPPYGAHNKIVDDIITELGYRSIFWNVDTLDWDRKYQPRKWIDHGLEQIKSRDHCVVLNHDIHKTTADNLGSFLQGINQLGNVQFEPPEKL